MRAQPKASHFIAGTYAESPQGTPFESLYPATGETIARLHMADAETIEAAISSAREGQMAWAATPAAARGRVLRKAAEILRARNRELSVLETLDTGKPLQETLVADAASGADCLEYYGNLAATLTGQHIDLGGSFAYTRREPLGLCVGIGAWNYPIQIACWKAAPALACGNAMIFKPSEVTPLSALKLAEALLEAGLPAGAFNVVQGGAETARRLISHPAVAKVSLTGSVATGARVAALAGENLKQTTLELGGKSPLIVFDDADVDNAVSAAINGNFYSSGQICSNGTRVFVHRAIRDTFLDRLAARTVQARIGDPLDEATTIGPLVSAAQMEKVLSYMELGRQEGARIVTGGGPARVPGFEGGWFVEPTVFADVRDDMRIAREEIFGPVMCLLDFSGEAEVIERANGTDFGLAAGVFTKDIQRAHRVVAALQAGTCWINAYNLTPVEMPFGGVKQSGMGRENGHAAIEHYSQIKSVYVEAGDVSSPF
ncbi:betaine-aldehyde dehydrogenase [Polymorphum gilvum]|uniref:Betaine aldehyde dehydrogenase n=1 Tax=Polymorphum gilvum (strain LMG 25793 / CGMCC 1.9160 / SL003B-26A1) TaxID=991905 RepID=F2J1T2_POLGS|nr:betaine-aldehyde dehydrogenase [Polymorphum gilvum]ADZ71993.1 Betaine aldehyde dehydrogenase, NAD-dependent [Polymorphum gilvum SL003B-26A1]